MLDIVIDIDQSLVAQSANFAVATNKQVEDARTKALQVTTGRIERAVKKMAAQRLNIPQKAISDRFRSKKISPGDDTLRVWIGAWAVDPFSIGNPNQTGRGVRVGRRSFPSAFVHKVYASSAKERVWIRVSSPNFKPGLYASTIKSAQMHRAGHKGRFPVLRVAIRTEDVLEDVLDEEGENFVGEFEKVFAQQLNYQVNVKK